MLDNTSAIAAMTKSISKAEALARAAAIAKQHLPEIHTTVEYVSTSINPADNASRGKEFCDSKLTEALGAMGRGEAQRRIIRRPRRDFVPNC